MAHDDRAQLKLLLLICLHCSGCFGEVARGMYFQVLSTVYVVRGNGECGGRGQKWSCRLPIKTFFPAGHFPPSRFIKVDSHSTGPLTPEISFEMYTFMAFLPGRKPQVNGSG